MRMVGRLGWFCRAWSVLVLLGCTSSTDSTLESGSQTLMEASQQVVFASTEQLGPHRLRSVLNQTEYHGEDIRNQHKEVLLIDWMDWDHWQATQLVDDEVVSEILIMDGACLERVGPKYVERPDGEPYRVQLRSMWNQWDSVVRSFEPNTTWTYQSTMTIDGRKVQQYSAAHVAPSKSSATLFPKRFEGNVWVDEATAVRLLADVTGEWINGPYKKVVTLKIERSEIASDTVGERLADNWSKIQVEQN